MPAVTTTIQYHTGDSSQNTKAQIKINGVQNGKEEMKLSLLADDMIGEVPKESTPKLLEYVSFSSSQDTKSTGKTQTIPFPYFSHEQFGIEKKSYLLK